MSLFSMPPKDKKKGTKVKPSYRGRSKRRKVTQDKDLHAAEVPHAEEALVEQPPEPAETPAASQEQAETAAVEDSSNEQGDD